MKRLSVDFFGDFECIGGDCPISCCGGYWVIDIDEQSEKYYQSVKGKFGKRLAEAIVEIDGGTAFKFNERGDCIFLNSNKLCDLYRELGADKLCLTCKTYPRMYYMVGDILICYLTNSCPELNRIIMQRTEPLAFLLDDSCNTEYEKILSNEESEEMDWIRFNHAIKAYTTGIDILQNREISISNRLILLVLYISRFQEIVEGNGNPADLTGIFSTSELYKMFLENNPVKERDCISKLHAFMMVFRQMMEKSYDHPMWDGCIKLANLIADKTISEIDDIRNAYNLIDDESIQIEFEQIMVYRFYAVFMRGFKYNSYMDKLAYEYVLYAALLTYIVEMKVQQEHTCTREERVLFYSLCSRIDHANDTKDDLMRAIREEGYNELETMLKLVS